MRRIIIASLVIVLTLAMAGSVFAGGHGNGNGHHRNNAVNAAQNYNYYHNYEACPSGYECLNDGVCPYGNEKFTSKGQHYANRAGGQGCHRQAF